MNRKIIALLTACLMVFSFASCGKDDKDQNTEPTTAESTTAPKLALSGVVESGEFDGKEFNLTTGHYKDTKEIVYKVYLQSIAKEYKITYSYAATVDGVQIDKKDNLEVINSDVIEIVIKSEELIPEGHLVVTVMDEDGHEVSVGECDVLQTPEPTIADLTGFALVKGQTVTFPGTEITINVDNKFEVVQDAADPSSGAASGSGEKPLLVLVDRLFLMLLCNSVVTDSWLPHGL